MAVIVAQNATESGVIDLAGFLGALLKIGYDVPVVPEPFAKELAGYKDGVGNRSRFHRSNINAHSTNRSQNERQD